MNGEATCRVDGCDEPGQVFWSCPACNTELVCECEVHVSPIDTGVHLYVQCRRCPVTCRRCGLDLAQAPVNTCKVCTKVYCRDCMTDTEDWCGCGHLCRFPIDDHDTTPCFCRKTKRPEILGKHTYTTF